MGASTPELDFKAVWMNDPEIFALYRYQPSLNLAIVAFICFFISTIVHVVQAWRYRTGYFLPLIVGGFFEWTGYVGRIFAHLDQYALGIYVWQTLVLLLDPTLFAATIYMIVSAIIHAIHGEGCSPIRASRLTRIFIAGDILAFFIQGGGMPPIVTCLSQYIGMIASYVFSLLLLLQWPTSKGLNHRCRPQYGRLWFDTPSNFLQYLPHHQCVFHYRISHHLPTHSTSCSPSSPNRFHTSATSSLSIHLNSHLTLPFPYQRYLFSLYFASTLILIRTLLRVVEFMRGHAGKLMAAEWYLYAFDAVLMLGVMASLNVWHPGRIGGRELARRGERLRLYDLEGEGHEQAKELKEIAKVKRMGSREAGRVGPMA